MRGCFYGVGVGPGDPELVTLKAVRIIREVPVIAYPGGQPMDSTAWKIAAASVPEIRDKEKLGIDVPMTRDAALLEGAHRRAIRQIEALLDQGKSVAYITLGDPTIYSSYSYLQADIMKDGYRVETVSGVPSFCAAAAKLNIPLSEWEEELAGRLSIRQGNGDFSGNKKGNRHRISGLPGDGRLYEIRQKTERTQGKAHPAEYGSLRGHELRYGGGNGLLQCRRDPG